VVKAGIGAALSPFVLGCTEKADQTVRDAAGYEMPPEADPHERTFMQWPASLAVYDRRSLAQVQRSIALIANTISQFEPVVLLASAPHHAAIRRLVGEAVELWDVPTDDLWCRDSGPTFVKDDSAKLAIAHLRFNGWGNKQPHGNDAQIAPRLAEILDLPLLDTGLVGEQGGVEHDGAGTLLAHASCWANSNRNTIAQDEIGERLLAALGGSQMIWAPGIKGADITDYHIDALARFVAAGKVLIQLGAEIDPDDPWSVSGHQTLGILQQSTDAAGRPLEIVRLPDPVDIRSRKRDFVASYVNYYVCNDAVIAAEFGDDEADAAAKALLGELYPARTIAMIDIDPIGEAGGGIHCATQQQPKSGIL
jgi:agmatine deiminase